jgi:hypothetical protein
MEKAIDKDDVLIFGITKRKYWYWVIIIFIISAIIVGFSFPAETDYFTRGEVIGKMMLVFLLFSVGFYFGIKPKHKEEVKKEEKKVIKSKEEIKKEKEKENNDFLFMIKFVIGFIILVALYFIIKAIFF